MSSVIWHSFSHALVLCSLLASGCQAILGIEELHGRSDGGVTDAATPDAGAPGFSFAVLTVNATIPLDGTNVLDVELQRTGGFTGEVTITALSPPTGIEVETLILAGGQTAGQLAVGARAPLLLGDTVSFDLVATASGVPMRMAAIAGAEITGKPGSLDASFGAQATGYAAVSFGNDDGGAFFDLDVLGNGDILALGWGTGGLGANRFAITRLLAGGAPDASFQQGALVRTDFESGSTGENAQAYAVGRQVDGRIIAIGWHEAGTAFLPDIALARYGADGVVGDLEFGNYRSGKSRIDLGGNEQVTDGLVLPDSSILAVGQRDGQLFVARATPTGYLDTSFAAPAGYHVLTLAPSSGAEAVITDPEGRLLVAGFLDRESRDMLVLRYTADGALDPSFGQGGYVVLGDPVASEHAMAIAVRPDGRIVVAGHSNAAGNLDFELRQLLADGSPDPAFGPGDVGAGVARPPITAANDLAADMLVLPDGRILVAGNSEQGGPMLARYTRAGQLDPYFGQAGLLGPYIGESGVIHTVELHASSKVLIAGGNAGGTPGPGTFGIIVRMWM
jgi:uncharacterized delta-60 repeat protein